MHTIYALYLGQGLARCRCTTSGASVSIRSVAVQLAVLKTNILVILTHEHIINNSAQLILSWF